MLPLAAVTVMSLASMLVEDTRLVRVVRPLVFSVKLPLFTANDVTVIPLSSSRRTSPAAAVDPVNEATSVSKLTLPPAASERVAAVTSGVPSATDSTTVAAELMVT